MIPTRTELCRILGLEQGQLPRALGERKVMVIGFEGELMRRYPDADKLEILDWSARYINSRVYLRRLLHCRHRHDLDGNNVRSITHDDRSFAAAVLKGRKQIDPTDINAYQPQAGWVAA